MRSYLRWRYLVNKLHPLYVELCDKCDDIDHLWSNKAYNLTAFPEIVDAVIRDLDLTPLGALDNLIDLLSEPEIARQQQLSSFSDLYLRLYDNGRFWIEILNWWGSDINIHAAVQYQLCGRSLNVEYSFERAVEGADFCLGVSTIRNATMWRPGNRSFVYPGRNRPHNVCHLDTPTMSLLVRTYPSKSFGPQWNYFPPAVAGNYGIADVVFRKRVKALRLISRGAPSIFESAFRRHMEGATPETTLFTLMKMIDILFEPDKVHLIYELLESGEECREHIVECVALHRAVEAMKVLRRKSGLTSNEQLSLAVLASAYDATSTREISRLIFGESDAWRIPIEGLLFKLQPEAAARVEATLTLFELSGATAEA
jgi:hypothetical protein